MDDLAVPLRTVALQYYDLGWHPLPLPPNAKKSPPPGTTGYGGTDLTRAQIEAIDWSGNIGLRMPPDVIGLDVDCYRGGGETLAMLIAKCGPLPETWISHSGRNDGSGIRFYRVPRLLWVHALAGIEVIQAGHRYSVAHPSTHPDGRQYGWFDQSEGGRAESLPAVEDLPELGWAWIAELSRAQVADVEGGRSYAVDRSGVGTFIEAHVVELAPSYITTITDHFVSRVNEGFSRHDSMTHSLLWALEHVRAGVAAAAPTLDALAELWVQAVAGDARRCELTSPRRTTEWEAMVRHAVGRVNAKSDEEIRVLHDDVVGPVMNVPVIEPTPPPPTSTPEGEVQPPDEEEVRFRRWSVPELLAVDRTFRWDVVGMLAQHTYGLDAGELKTLKSYFGLARDVGLAAGVPVLGKWEVPERRRVLVFVAEGGLVPYVNRLERMALAHGVAPSSLDGWLAVIDDVASMTSGLFREALERHLRDFAPAIVHLDPLYPFQPAEVSPSQYTEVGKMLTATHRLCAEHGATLWITAHMNQGGNGFDLKRVSGAGHGEWGDSWALLRHRDQPDVDAGRFRLGLALGSRQWGGTSWDLDLNIGRFDADLGLHDGPITWAVRPASVVGTASSENDDPVADVRVLMLRAGHNAKRPLTRQGWMARVHRRAELKRAAFDELVDAGEIVQVEGSGTPTFTIRGLS